MSGWLPKRKYWINRLSKKQLLWLALSILRDLLKTKRVINILPNLQAYFNKRRYFPILMSTFGQEPIYCIVQPCKHELKHIKYQVCMYVSKCTYIEVLMRKFGQNLILCEVKCIIQNPAVLCGLYEMLYTWPWCNSFLSK